MTKDEIKELLEADYKLWIKKQDIKSIDENDVKESILTELNLFMGMSVEEYTLYIKWNYLRELYPNKIGNTFFTSSIIDQYPEVNEVKSNIWIPNDPNDFLLLEPELIYCDKKELTHKWTILRHFTSTMNYKGLVGRRLNFIVRDKITQKYLGVFCLSSDFLDLVPRDKYIGWTRDIKTYGMINHTGIGSTIVPTQPLGFGYLGGKLLALLITSDYVENTWNEKYHNNLAGITTTSLYGSFSQYNSLKYWKKMGKTNGSIKFNHTSSVSNKIKSYLKFTDPEFYHKCFVFQKPSGSGPFYRDATQRGIMNVYAKLGIKLQNVESKHQRGIYFCPLYENTCEFLRKEQSELKNKKFDNSIGSLTKLWKDKYASKRCDKLVNDGKFTNCGLFYDDMLNSDWSQIKEKYLKDVGR